MRTIFVITHKPYAGFFCECQLRGVISDTLLIEFPFQFSLYLHTDCVTAEALCRVIDAAKPGFSVLSLCELGDAYIMAETGKVFKKEKEMKKGEALS